MFDLLDRLRQKSERHRRFVTLITVTIITTIIFVVWTTSLLSRLGNAVEDGEVVQTQKEPTPLTSITGQISSLIDDTKKRIQSFQAPVEYQSDTGTAKASLNFTDDISSEKRGTTTDERLIESGNNEGDKVEEVGVNDGIDLIFP